MLAKNLGCLKVSDELIWEKIEKYVSRKPKDLSPVDITNLIDGASRAKFTSITFWNKLEEYILESIYVNSCFDPNCIGTVINGFDEVDKGSQQLFKQLKQNTIQFVQNLRSRNFHSILHCFIDKELIDQEFVITMTEKALMIKDELYGFNYVSVYSSLIKMGADENAINIFEREFIEKIDSFTLANLASISGTYAKFYGSEISQPGAKHDLMATIEDTLYRRKSYLESEAKIERLDFYFLKIMTALAKAKCIYKLELWQQYKIDIKSKSFYQEPEIQPKLGPIFEWMNINRV